MNKNKVLLLVALLSLVLACSITNLPTSGGSTPIPTAVASVPVGIQAGLASLNSYSLAIDSNISGPTQAEYSRTRIEILKSKDQDAISTHYNINQLSAGASEPSTTDSYSYTIGNASCSGSEEDGWDFTESTPQQTEMQKLLAGMLDFLPIIDDPIFVGNETMNGIMTRHLSFQLSGLGVESGAQSTTNQGNYWLAQDGQYIVKYSLVAETQDPATQAVAHLDILIDLTGINQPVDIAFPAGCVP